MENLQRSRGITRAQVRSDIVDIAVGVNLSECLLERILLSLPLVSMAKFRTVCRHWNHLLRSKSFLERHEDLHPPEEPWILSIVEVDSSCVMDVYNQSYKIWRRINFRSSLELELSLPHMHLSWVMGWLSDGGLVCTKSTVFNPLTCSTRHLSWPVEFFYGYPRGYLTLSAFKVNRRTNFYQVFVLGHRGWLLSGEAKPYDFLGIYDSREDSWCRIQDSPIPLDVEEMGLCFNDCIYFIMRPDRYLIAHEKLELNIICYNFSKKEWESCIIFSQFTGSPWKTTCNLHQWQNRMYVISFSRRESILYVEEIRMKSRECHTLETMSEQDFEVLFPDKFSTFQIQDVKTCENFILVPIIGHSSCCDHEFSTVVVYDLSTRKWSFIKKPYHVFGFNVFEWTVGFEPRLNVEA